MDATGASARRFGVYVHVPFCSVRCGYCDFNTYAPGELDGASPEGYVEAALAEMAFARGVMGDDTRQAATVFFGGGTPTLLDTAALGRLLDGVRDTWGIAADAEVTTEANPDSVSEESMASLRAAGFTRVSFGMQSAVPHVLATLERTHNPENVARAVRWARGVGLDVSLDLIYGTPGESLGDWQLSLDAALKLEPDHLSAYALVIEPGTKMGAQMRRGKIASVIPDVQAKMYEFADEAFTVAGFSWYEVSNWARTPKDACRHNIGYWKGDDWWGVGPGAHSYLAHTAEGAQRWWNVKHPRAYGERLAAGKSPEQERETLTGDQIALERVMLGVRLADGMALDLLAVRAREQAPQLAADGLIEELALAAGTLVLTRRGRLLADLVVRQVT